MVWGQNKSSMDNELEHLEGTAKDLQAKCNDWICECTSFQFLPSSFTVKNKFDTIFDIFMRLFYEVGRGSNLVIHDLFTGAPVPPFVSTVHEVEDGSKKQELKAVQEQIDTLAKQIDEYSARREFIKAGEAQMEQEKLEEHKKTIEAEVKALEKQVREMTTSYGLDS